MNLLNNTQKFEKYLKYELKLNPTNIYFLKLSSLIRMYIYADPILAFSTE
jgi:hypothetical protein